MRSLFLLVAIAVFALGGCSENPTGEAPKSGEAPKKGGLSSGMSEEIWKAYSGTESGVTDAQKDRSGEKK
jgi:hypothetical protein